VLTIYRVTDLSTLRQADKGKPQRLDLFGVHKAKASPLNAIQRLIALG